MNRDAGAFKRTHRHLGLKTPVSYLVYGDEFIYNRGSMILSCF